jgi:hypothetical protein
VDKIDIVESDNYAVIVDSRPYNYGPKDLLARLEEHRRENWRLSGVANAAGANWFFYEKVAANG